MKKPPISYIIVSYNNEQFIGEAVESALSQIYSPLEIIISDDCSDDRTFEITKKIVTTYTGPHSVRISRNHTNLGLGANINRAMELCHGEIVVAAAGDDISLPVRTELIYQAWEWSRRKATSIFSSYLIIDKDGASDGTGGFRRADHNSMGFTILNGNLLRFLRRREPVVNGCTHAWSPVLFKYFGPLRSGLEDSVLSFRTLGIGQMLYIHEPLVKYRRHGDNVSFLAERDDTHSFEHREKRLRWVDEQTVKAFDNMILDISTLNRNGEISKNSHVQLIAEAQRIRSFYDLEKQMMDGNLFHKLLVLAKAVHKGKIMLALRFSIRLMPKRIYRQLYIFREQWRNMKIKNFSLFFKKN